MMDFSDLTTFKTKIQHPDCPNDYVALRVSSIISDTDGKKIVRFDDDSKLELIIDSDGYPKERP